MDVVVVGSLNVDLQLRMERHPLPGETVLAAGGRFLPGGKGANQACAAALAGAHTAFAGAIGDDALGATATRLLESAGVDLSHLLRVQGATGLAVVSVDAEGENTVSVVAGANAAVTPGVVAGWADLISAAKVVVLQGEISAESSEAAAQAARGRLLVNLAPVIDVARDLLLAADPLIVNEGEGAEVLRRLTGAELDEPQLIVSGLRGAGVRSVVLTTGPSGCLCCESDEVVTVASPKVHAVDTVGAGDAFCGALAARLAAGDPLTTAAAYASRFAAYSVQFEGAQSSYPARGVMLPA